MTWGAPSCDDMILFPVRLAEIRGLAFGYLGHGLHPLRNVCPKGRAERGPDVVLRRWFVLLQILSSMLRLFPETKHTDNRDL